MPRSVSLAAMPVVLGLCPWLCAAAHAEGIQFVDPIVRTEQLNDTGDTVGPYVVRTVIYDQVTSDRGFFDHGVTLNYSVGAGPAKQVPMTSSGNSLWRGEIPGQPQGGTITYFVTALDSADNLGAGKDLSFTVGAIPGDLDGDGVVGVANLLLLLANWGPCPTAMTVPPTSMATAPSASAICSSCWRIGAEPTEPPARDQRRGPTDHRRRLSAGQESPLEAVAVRDECAGAYRAHGLGLYGLGKGHCIGPAKVG